MEKEAVTGDVAEFHCSAEQDSESAHLDGWQQLGCEQRNGRWK